MASSNVIYQLDIMPFLSHNDQYPSLDWDCHRGAETDTSATPLHHWVLSWVESGRSAMDSRVHSLMLSSHIFLRLARLLFPSTVPCNNTMKLLLCVEMSWYHDSFLLLILCSHWEPAMSFMVHHTYPFVLSSMYEISKIRWNPIISNCLDISNWEYTSIAEMSEE